MSTPGGPIRTPLFALAVGVLGSAAANTAWTWEHGPVRVFAGLFATALVPVGMHLWPRVPVTGWVTRALRVLVMSYICAAAAAVNLVHAVWLLTDHESWRTAENTLLAVLLVSAVEAVMVMASLARRRPAVMASAMQPAPVEPNAPVPNQPTSWGPRSTVSLPAAEPPTQPLPVPARSSSPTPSPTSAPEPPRSAAPRPSPVPAVRGWTPDMAAVPRDGRKAKDWVRARAAKVGLTQSGSHAELQERVQRAELERAGAEDDERERVSA